MFQDLNSFICDYDGVFIDSIGMYTGIYGSVLNEYGIKATEEQIMGRLVGKPTAEEIKPFFPKNMEKREGKISAAATKIDGMITSETGLSMLRLRPYARETLQVMKELRLAAKELRYKAALLTGSNRVFTKASLRHFSLCDYWNLVITADELDTFGSKEDAAMFIITQFNTVPERTGYLGDRAKDTNTARKIGCKSIGVLGGRWDTDEQVIASNPDFVISSLKDLYDELLQTAVRA